MARIIACSNIKGGEGKTTLSRHLALYASEIMGLRTLAIDLDPQGDLTVSLCAAGVEPSYFSPALFGEEFSVDEANLGLVKVSDKLDLLASSDDLDDIGDDRERNELVRSGRASIRALAEPYDVVIIDTPTNAPACYKTGMAAANCTLSPIQLDTYGMRGAEKFIRTSTKVKSVFNPTLKHIGFVVNRFNSRSKAQASMLEDLRASGLAVLPTVLRERAAVQDALDRQSPVWSGPRGTVNRECAKEFRQMCQYVLERAGVQVASASAVAA